MSIQQKLLELANWNCASVSGKKQYGYLKKPLKDMVDSIVDELETLPEVAAYYSVWNGVRDTLEGYYKNRPRQHNPLSQQKEFRADQERHHSGSGTPAAADGASAENIRTRIFAGGRHPLTEETSIGRFYKSDACR